MSENSPVIDKLVSLFPIWGYQYGKTEGFKTGMEAIAKEHEKLLKRYQNEIVQIKRDVFGYDNVFIAPEGWDETYWCNCLVFFLEGNKLELNAKEIVFAFTKAFLQKMDEKNLKTLNGAPLTYRLLSMVQCTVSTSDDKMMDLDSSFLGITVDFLDLFSPLKYDKQNKDLAEKLIGLRNSVSAILSGCSACNIMVIGRTGVGKSSLLNYLLGDRLFKTAVGKPQTMCFEEKEGVINNIKVRVYDSRGLEIGRNAYDYDDFVHDLNKFKQQHDVLHPSYNWIHAAIYCIPKRYQPVDCEIIKNCMEDKFKVVVALTKMDGLQEEEIKIIKKQLTSDCSTEKGPCVDEKDIIPVCSVNRTDREGNFYECFGKEELIPAILRGFKSTLLELFPKRCIVLAQKEIDVFCKNLKRAIDSRDFALFNNTEDINWFKTQFNSFTERFEKKILPEIAQKELNNFFSSCIKMTLCFDGFNEHDYRQDFIDVFGTKWGTKLGSNTAKIDLNNKKNVAIVSLVSVAGVVLLSPALYVALGGIAMEIWSLWNKKDNLRKELKEELDRRENEIKDKLGHMESEIRSNLYRIMEN